MSGPIETNRPAFQRRTIKVKLYNGDWQQRIDQALKAVESAHERLEEARRVERDGRPRLLTDAPESESRSVEHQQAVAEHDRLLAEAEKDGVLTVTIQALPRRKWAAMVAKHPPRTDESLPEETRENDRQLGINDDALGEDLVPACIIETSDPDLKVDDLLDEVSSAQWDLLYGAAFAVNRGVGSSPKALSSHTPTSAATST